MTNFDCPDNPTWHNSIKHMFTEGDIACMRAVRGFDLDDYAFVKAAAGDIFRTVSEGSMPPGHPWNDEKVACFKKWMDADFPEGMADADEPTEGGGTGNGDTEPTATPNWHPTNAPPGGSRYDDIWFISPEVGWAVNSNGEILHTTDGWDTWQKQFQTPIVNRRPIYLRCVSFVNAQKGWVGTVTFDERMYHTQDGGQSWNPVTTLPAEAPAKICGLHVVNESVIYASGTNDPVDVARMMKSVDGGQTWTAWDMSEHASALIDVYFFRCRQRSRSWRTFQ